MVNISKTTKVTTLVQENFLFRLKNLSNDTNIGTFVQSRKYWSKVVRPTGPSCVKIRSKLQKLISTA